MSIGTEAGKFAFFVIGGVFLVYLASSALTKVEQNFGLLNPTGGQTGGGTSSIIPHPITALEIEADDVAIGLYRADDFGKPTELEMEVDCLEVINNPAYGELDKYEYAIYWLAPRMVFEPSRYEPNDIIIDFTYVIKNPHILNPVLKPPKNDSKLYDDVSYYIFDNPSDFSTQAKDLAYLRIQEINSVYANIMLHQDQHTDQEIIVAAAYIDQHRRYFSPQVIRALDNFREYNDDLIEIVTHPNLYPDDQVRAAATYINVHFAFFHPPEIIAARKWLREHPTSTQTTRKVQRTTSNNNDFYQPGQLRSVTPFLASLIPTMGTPNGKATGDLF